MTQHELFDTLLEVKEKAQTLMSQMSLKNWVSYVYQMITNVEFTIQLYADTISTPSDKDVFLLKAWCRETRLIANEIFNVKEYNKDDIENYSEILEFKLEELEITLCWLQKEPIEYYF